MIEPLSTQKFWPVLVKLFPDLKNLRVRNFYLSCEYNDIVTINLEIYPNINSESTIEKSYNIIEQINGINE